MSKYWVFIEVISSPRLLLTFLPIILMILAIVVWASTRYRITRRQLNRFAERQRIIVTPENGILLVEALSISHRWRRFGLALGVLTGVAVSVAAAPPHSLEIYLNSGAMFLGWFAGALVGEWRIASRPVVAGTRRVA